MLRSELVVGYIDDITIGGRMTTVDEDVTIIKRNGLSRRLHFDITKCELISSIMLVQSQSLNEFIAVSPPDASLIGAPIFSRAVKDAALNKKLEEFKRFSSNIKLINAYDAQLILKASSSTSHILFMLFYLPCLGNAILSQIDEVLKFNISHIANVVFLTSNGYRLVCL